MKEEIKQTVHDIVLNSNQRLTPIDVEKRVATEIRADKQMIKTAITELVNEGVLRYTYHVSVFWKSRSTVQSVFPEELWLNPHIKCTHLKEMISSLI